MCRRRKVHTVWEDLGGIEMAEEYDLYKDELLVRKLRKPTVLGGEGEWVYEVGLFFDFYRLSFH